MTELQLNGGYAIGEKFFFFNDTAPPEIYSLSLHDALPISSLGGDGCLPDCSAEPDPREHEPNSRDRKRKRLNSSHDKISNAVFCLKKKKNNARLFRIIIKIRAAHARRARCHAV